MYSGFKMARTRHVLRQPTRLTLVVVVVLGAAGCGNPAPVPPPDPADTAPIAAPLVPPAEAVATRPRSLTIATYNINYANVELAAVVDAIRQSDADVVCLQEANAESAGHLRDTFSRDYSVIRFDGSTDRYLAGGFGLLSRLPLQSQKFLPAEHGLFGTCFYELDVDGLLVQVVNVHLQPVVLGRRRDELGWSDVRQALLATEQIHQQEIEAIAKRIQPLQPSLVVGDFNSLATFIAPTRLAELGYRDSLAEVESTPDSHPTWHWPTRFGEVSLRIDYVFHSPALSTTQCRVIPTPGSDHCLLVSRLELSAAAK